MDGEPAKGPPPEVASPVSGTSADRPPEQPWSSWWPVLLFVFGLWGLAAPYASTAAGFHIPVPANVEFVDHVVPGIVVLAVALLAVFKGSIGLIPALASTLGGFWMTSTHLLTLRDGFRGAISLTAALIHSLPGLAILAVSAAAALKAYRLIPDE